MRYAARLVALVIATLLGCLFFGDVWVLTAVHRLGIENGHQLPPSIHMQDIIAVGAIGLAFISFCLLFRFLGRNHGSVKRTLALLIGVLALVYVGYRYRLHFEAVVWHWRHGNFAAIGGYEIPVPSQWLVLDQGRSSVQMADTATGSLALINVPNLPTGHSQLDLNFWASSWKQAFGLVNARFVVQRSLKMGVETVLCLGERASEPRPLTVGISDLTCASSRGLLLRFTGPQADVQQFYAVVQGIRREPRP